MPTYEIKAPDGRTFEVTAPEGASQADVLAYAKKNMGGGSNQAPRQPTLLDRPRNSKITADDLRKDPRWIEANRIIYRALEGDDSKVSDDKIHSLGLREQALLGYSTFHMAETANAARKFTPEQRKALAYAMEVYDRTDNSWTIAGNTTFAIATDPLSWLPIGRMTGLATKATPVGKFLSREAFLQFLKRGVDTGIEGAIGAGAQNYIRQDINKQTGRQKEFDLGQFATETGIGFGAGKILGGAADVIAGRLAARSAAKDAAANLANDAARVTDTVTNDAIPSNLPSEAAQSVDNAMPATGVADEAPLPSTASVADSVATAPQQLELFPRASDEAAPAPRVDAPAAGTSDSVGSLVNQADESVPVSQVIPDKSPESNVEPFRLGEAPEARSVAEQIVSAIKEISADSGARVLTNTKEGISEAVSKASNLIADLGIETADDVTEALRRAGFTPEQQYSLETALSQASTKINAVLTEAQKAGLPVEELDKIAQVASPIVKADLALSRKEALSMRMRQGEFVTGAQRAKATVEDYVSEIEKEAAWAKASPEERRAEGYKRLAADYDSYLKGVETAPVVQDLSQRISNAIDAGDMETAVHLSVEKAALMEEAAREQMEAAGFTKQAIDAAENFTRLLTSYVKNVVFSPKTLLVNAVWPAFEAFARPIVSATADGFSAEANRELAATYYAMWKVRGQALQAAKFAFKHSTTMLTGEIDKFETHTRLPNIVLPEKLRVTLPVIGEVRRLPIGSVLEVFSRSMLATDEFFSQLIYRGKTEGRAAFDAYIEASHATQRAVQQAKDKGLTGKAYKDFVRDNGFQGKKLKAFISDKIEKTLDEAYKSEATDPHSIDLIRKTGVRKGYTGKALEDYIRIELHSSEKILSKAASQTGRDFVNDALLRREFSGNTKISKIARKFEGILNENPILQLMGQLFYRTPIRAFQQGLRVTPGVNLVTPGFLADLAGKTTREAQLKASGDMLLSYAAGMGLAVAYATGSITGSGPKDFKQRRNLENTGWRPNSIKTDEGWMSYRNLDPIATPFKIMSNALDKLGELREKRGAGYDTTKEEVDAGDYFRAGMGAIGQAFRDANLTEGVDQVVNLVEMMFDEDSKDNAWSRFFAEKVKLLVPNVVRQSLDLEASLTGNQNPLPDARIWSQYVDSIFSPNTSSTPVQYDALGNVRKKTSSLWGMLGFDYVKNEALQTGKTEKERAVLQALSEMELATGVTFVAPYMNKTYLGDLDLREQMTEDGKNTLYDRWMQYYHESGVTDALYQAIQSNSSVGTSEQRGVKVAMVQGIISDFREAAFAQMMRDELQIPDKYRQLLQNKANTLQGERDDRFIQNYQ